MISKTIVGAIAKTYLSVRKAFLSDFLYGIFGSKWESKEIWDKIKDYDVDKFSNYLGQYSYKADPLCGAIDYSHKENEPEYFFADLKQGRDCDDFALEWKTYLQYHPEEWEDVHQVVLTSRETIQTCFAHSHFVTIAKNKKDGKYYLFNYRFYNQGFDSIEQAVLSICERSKTYTEDNIWWTLYD